MRDAVLRECVGVVVFEGGGQPQRGLTVVERDLRAIRHAVTLDTLEFLAGLGAKGDVSEVVLVSDREELAERAGHMGIDVEPAPVEFHFGTALRDIVLARGWDDVIVLGGAAGPLLLPDDVASVARVLREQKGVAVLNNPQSPDLLGFAPARVLRDLPPAGSDNELGQTLLAAGLRRVLMDNSPRVNFDLDTPTDCAVLAGELTVGRRTRRAVDACAWIPPVRRRLEQVTAVLAREMAEVALIGRVGPPVTAHLNAMLRCRLRVFSEERGMRALGRERDGRVCSLVGLYLDELGPERFFAHLDRVADAALFDSRVLMAHWKRPLPDRDRFHSDIGAVEMIADPLLRAFTAAAWGAGSPVVLGGHTLVYGGLWLLGERASAVLPALQHEGGVAP